MICNIFSSYDFGAVTNKRCNFHNKNLERREIDFDDDFKFQVVSCRHHDYVLNLSMSKKPEPHPYNCGCNDCIRKHGNLPLLVQVIEGREKYQASTSTYRSFDSGASTSSDTNKNITCPHCNKSFSHRGDYNKHLRTHTGEQPFACSICKRRFAHTSNLNRHIRVHTGDRPYLCDVCNKNFNRKDKLDMHKKTKLCKNSSEKNSSSSK